MRSTLFSGPYNDEDIYAFASKLRIEGGFVKVQKDGIRRNFAGMIAGLPAWQKVLLIESGFCNVASDFGTLNLINRCHDVSTRNILGLYLSGQWRTDIDGLGLTFNTKSGIFWTFNRYGDHDAASFHHEHGHRVADMIGTFGDPAFLESVFLDETVWDAAVACEVIHGGGDGIHRSADDADGAGASMHRSGDPSADGVPYAGCRAMASHLENYEWEKFPDEAFAEMNAHYCMLYALWNGDERRIDDELSERTPFLWPLFRDSVIPEGKRIADMLLERRDRAGLYRVLGYNPTAP